MPNTSVEAIAYLRNAAIYLRRQAVWANADSIRIIESAMSDINRTYLTASL